MKAVLRLTGSTLLATVVLLMFASQARAQITISSADILGLIGASQTYTEKTDGSTAVDVGSAGPNQTWDFSSLSITGETFTQSYLAPAGTPFEAEAPGANMVISAVFDTVTSYQYIDVQSSMVNGLGFGFVSPDTSIFEPEISLNDLPLPVEYLSTWTDVDRDTVSVGGFSIINIDSSITTVDAWGTVTMPWGTANVQRWRLDDVFINQQVQGGMILFADTSRSITYEWISRENLFVVSLGSQDGETNPNFTDAEYVSILAGVTTGVDDLADGVDTGAINALYPNPFADELTVELTVANRDAVVEVYDMLGRRVRTLTHNAASGEQRLSWDGLTDSGSSAATGVYFVRVSDGEKADMQSVVLKR